MTLSLFVKATAAGCLYHSGALSLCRSLFDKGRAIILMYHRVNDADDPFFPALSPRVFSRQLDFLARNYRVVSLEDLMEWLATGAPGKPRVAITIDDGYPDTHDVVWPELARRGLTASLFLSTSPPETGAPLWIDRLRHTFKRARKTDFDLSDHGMGSGRLTSVESRLATLRWLIRELKDRQPETIQGVVASIRSELAPEGAEPRTLSWEQVREMANGGCFTIGAHTHNHYLLSRLSDSEVEHEIRTSIELVRQRLGRPVRTFCYPNGRYLDFDARSIDVLRSLGILYAVSSETGFVGRTDDPLVLPRFYTSENKLPLFATRLSGLGLPGRSRHGSGGTERVWSDRRVTGRRGAE